jgi:transglutaminase-like putative cysteine protease
MNFAIRYLTEYRYEGRVTDNLNALRVRPATTSSQRVDDFHVRVDPEARLQRHLDYYGTEVIEFGVAQPHDHLSIDVRARVVTAEPDEPPDEGWEALAGSGYESAGGEFLLPTGDEPEDGDVDELYAASRARSPLATVRLVSELIPDRFEYRQGATYVGSSIQDLLDAGAGVCQDFVHLGLLLLRRRGIAVRYVSGYLWAAPEAKLGGDTQPRASHSAGTGDSVEVETHAWLEALVPGAREPVWVPADPTNRTLGGETHVKIGHGRNYADVPPIKGVYRGGAGADLKASVKMTRSDPSPARA